MLDDKGDTLLDSSVEGILGRSSSSSMSDKLKSCAIVGSRTFVSHQKKKTWSVSSLDVQVI